MGALRIGESQYCGGWVEWWWKRWLDDVVRCGFQFIEIVVKKGLIVAHQGVVLRLSEVLVSQLGKSMG